MYWTIGPQMVMSVLEVLETLKDGAWREDVGK